MREATEKGERRPVRNLGAGLPKIQTPKRPIRPEPDPALSAVRLGRAPSTVGPSVLQTDHPALVQFLRDTIQARGPVPFAFFMEQALYHPAHGYYSSGRCTIGRQGYYYTSVSGGPVFGRLLAAQFAEMWTALGHPGDFTIVEQGAHDGTFARALLEAARHHHRELFAALRYVLVEPFPILRARQEERLAPFAEQI